MTYSLTWMPQVLREAGLKVAEVEGWATRGRSEMGRVRGVMCHHTGTATAGNMPTLHILKVGHGNLPGPLSQLGLGRDGTFYIVAAGRANHAGKGNWRGIETGNSSFIGIEAENAGVPGSSWPEIQLDAYRRGVAALLRKIGAGAEMCCGHKEYCRPVGRKPDPYLVNMSDFRNEVRAVLHGTAVVRAQIPAVDAKSGKPTVRRGGRGDDVRLIQNAVKVMEDGKFGPNTEAAVRRFQRLNNLVPDGIVGPATWATMQTINKQTGEDVTVVAMQGKDN